MKGFNLMWNKSQLLNWLISGWSHLCKSADLSFGLSCLHYSNQQSVVSARCLTSFRQRSIMWCRKLLWSSRTSSASTPTSRFLICLLYNFPRPWPFCQLNCFSKLHPISVWLRFVIQMLEVHCPGTTSVRPCLSFSNVLKRHLIKIHWTQPPHYVILLLIVAFFFIVLLGTRAWLPPCVRTSTLWMSLRPGQPWSGLWESTQRGLTMPMSCWRASWKASMMRAHRWSAFQITLLKCSLMK